MARKTTLRRPHASIPSHVHSPSTSPSQSPSPAAAISAARENTIRCTAFAVFSSGKKQDRATGTPLPRRLRPCIAPSPAKLSCCRPAPFSVPSRCTAQHSDRSTTPRSCNLVGCSGLIVILPSTSHTSGGLELEGFPGPRGTHAALTESTSAWAVACGCGCGCGCGGKGGSQVPTSAHDARRRVCIPPSPGPGLRPI
jgi:hypothetical protein